MDTFSVLFNIILNNINFIFPVVFLYLIICFVGVSFFAAIVRKTNWILTLSAGMIVGQLSLIIFLGILSHLLKGKSGILTIFIFFLSCGVLVHRKFRHNLPNKTKLLKPKNLIIILLSTAILGFLLFFGG